MQIEVLKGGWVKQGSVIAFPHEWQRPAKTEEWVYEVLIKKKYNSQFSEYIAFPWATLIDLLNRGKLKRASYLITALENIPPKKTLVRATSCQHIEINKILKYFSQIKLTDVYWAHKTKTIKENHSQIRFHPLPMYPFAYYAVKENERISLPIHLRRYRYSFIGAYDEKLYISDIRSKILKLEYKSNAIVEKKNQWHFERLVYDNDINETEVSDEYINKYNKDTLYYAKVLANTQFSLCPSGAGPNSIRLWESVAFGCIPIILSDDLELPFDDVGIVCLEKNFYSFMKICETEKFSYNLNFSRLNPDEWIDYLYIDLCDIKKILDRNFI